MTHHVYALYDPRSPVVMRYVGVTVNPESRRRSHQSLVREPKSSLDHWRREVILARQVVGFKVLASGPPSLEVEWYRRLLAEGHPLLNGSEVGLGMVRAGNVWSALHPGLRDMASAAAKRAKVPLGDWLAEAVRAHLRQSRQ